MRGLKGTVTAVNWSASIVAKLIAGLAASGVVCSASLAQTQEQQLIPASIDGGDHCGWSMSVDGTTALIGAPWDDKPAASGAPAVNRIGSARFVGRVGANWVETQPPLFGVGNNTNDGFGLAVALRGNRAIVGAPYHTNVGVQAGSAYVFENAASVWSHKQELIAPNAPQSYDYFGSAVAIEGDVAFVGAPGRDVNGSSGAGSVYRFRRNAVTTAWQFAQEVTASVPQWSGSFGGRLELRGDLLFVGSHGADMQGTDSGAVYVFQLINNVWTEVQILQAGDPGVHPFLGVAIAFDGTRLAVGAQDQPWGRGAAYLFELQGGSWTQVKKLLPFDTATNRNFGGSVAISGDLVVVGDHKHDLPGQTSDWGGAYVFEKSGGGWVETAQLNASNGASNDYFGITVGLVGNTALIGAFATDHPTAGVDSGSLYAKEFSGALRTTPYGFCPASVSPCSNPDEYGGCRNVTGRGALLIDSGSTSVAADDLQLKCTRLPNLHNGLLFMGDVPVSTVQGNGLRCVGAGSLGAFRYAVHNTGSTGTIHEGPGLTALSLLEFPAAGQILAGQTWYFQVWYRDNSGSCGHVNFSNAIEVEFTP